jgi:hypothetical protein
MRNRPAFQRLKKMKKFSLREVKNAKDEATRF